MSNPSNSSGTSAQPSLNQAYETAGNPASKEPIEESRSAQNAQSDSTPVAHRVPTTQSSSQSSATPTSMARGVRGAPAGEEQHGLSQADVDRSNELDAEQMGAPGEGKVNAAVAKKPGADGNEPGLETDLDRKRAEQAPLRKQVQQEEQKEVDVGGVLGQRGGPANPVDGKGGYPNSGD